MKLKDSDSPMTGETWVSLPIPDLVATLRSRTFTQDNGNACCVFLSGKPSQEENKYVLQ